MHLWSSFFIFRAVSVNCMNTKDENAALGSFISAANTAKWPPCPYWSPWFVISQLNCGSKVLLCLFHKAPGLQHGIHVGVCGMWGGGGVWTKFFKGTVGSDRSAGWCPTHQKPGRPAKEVTLKGKKNWTCTSLAVYCLWVLWLCIWGRGQWVRWGMEM